MLIAFAAADGPSNATQTLTVSGAGLTWTLVKRANAQLGTAEIWRATATGPLTNAVVTSTETRIGFHQSLTVVTFMGAGGVGASRNVSAASGAPTLSLNTTKAGSLVFGVGFDYTAAIARTPGTSQVMVHELTDATATADFWVQRRFGYVATSGTAVQINDTAPTSDRWNLAAVEIVVP